MASNIILKKSSVVSKVPVAGDLQFGELALNYADGKLYYKKSDGTTIDAFSSAASSGVSSVTGTAPIISSGGTTPAISISAATTSAAGSMSAADKTKLDGIASGATANTGTVTSVATNNGLTGGTITTTGTIGLTGQALALHNLTTNGIVARTGSDTVAARTLTAGTGISITNGDGVSGNPTITATNNGTVTSVGGTGTVSGLTLSGTVTSSGNLTLGGTLSLTSGNVTTALGFTPYNATNPSGYITSSGSITGNAATATNISNTGTVTLATATESNDITITAPSYTSDTPVKLLDFNWYGNKFSLGNIRSGSTPSSGFGVYYTASGGSRTEIARFGTAGTFNTVGAITQNGNQVLHADNYNSYAPTLTGTGASGSWGISITGSSASTTGNAATATTLQTARTINGVSFNGSANITVVDSTKQPLDADLTAIAALTGTTGLLRKTAADTWSLDTNAYVTSSGVTAVSGTAPIISSGGTAPAISISAATTSAAGSMSAADKTKLDGIASGATANTGTVTSVATSGTVSGLTLTGGTITTTGTITLGGTLAVTPSNFASQTANTVLAAPNGSAGTPTFRALVASDIPEITLEKLPDAWVKRAVRVATTTNITLSGTQTIDGIAVVAGDRVLVKDQTTASTNGIYVVSATAWSRSSDADAASELGAAQVAVDSGSTNGGYTFDTDFKTTDTLGTTAMNWSRVLDTAYLSTVGNSFATLANPSAITFPRINANNTVSALDAATFRTAIGAGTSSTTGTVTSVAISGGTTGLTTSGGPITSSGTITIAGTLAIANGGTGATTRQDAMDALAGAVTSGQYLRGNGTDVVMSAIQAADVPTLNQNTSGTAAVSTAATITTSATASAFKVPFANTTASTTGNYGLLQDSEATFTYNPSSNTLTVGTVSGALSGNATTATTASTANALNTSNAYSGTVFRSSNGITVNSATISANYTIAAGDNGMSAGPVSVNSGITVTVSSGSVWTII